MRIIRDYQFVNQADRGATVAIGNFDGVHQGHLSVIDLARQACLRSSRIRAAISRLMRRPFAS